MILMFIPSFLETNNISRTKGPQGTSSTQAVTSDSATKPSWPVISKIAGYTRSSQVTTGHLGLILYEIFVVYLIVESIYGEIYPKCSFSLALANCQTGNFCKLFCLSVSLLNGLILSYLVLCFCRKKRKIKYIAKTQPGHFLCFN